MEMEIDVVLKDPKAWARCKLLKGIAKPGNLTMISLVFMDTHEGRLRLRVNNFEIEMGVLLDADIKTEGSCVVSADRLAGALGACGDTPRLCMTGAQLAITGKGRRFTLATSDCFREYQFGYTGKLGLASDFLTVDSRDFINTINNVVYCTSSDATRANLCGVHCQVSGKTSVITATDGYQVSRVKTKKLPIGMFSSETGLGLLIVDNFVKKIIALAGDSDQFDFRATEKVITVKSDNWWLHGSATYPGYPDVDKIIPSPVDCKWKVVVSVADLDSAIKDAMMLCDKDFTELEFVITDNSMIIKAKALDGSLGNVNIDVTVERMGDNVSPDVRVGIQGKFLRCMLASFQDEKIELSLYDLELAMSPMTWRSVTPHLDFDRLAILMPVRLDR